MADPQVKAIMALNAPLIALVPPGRMHAQVIPQAVRGSARAYPCIVFTRVGSYERETVCGADDFVTSLWQLDTYGKDRDEVIAAAGALRNALVHYSGDAGGVHVHRIRRDTSSDGPPEPEPGLYRRIQTFTIWYLEN